MDEWIRNSSGPRLNDGQKLFIVIHAMKLRGSQGKNSLRFNPDKPLLSGLLYDESGNLALPNMQIAEVLYSYTFKIKGSERYLAGMHP